MEKGKLTAIIKSPLNSNFDEQYRVLTIAEGESFTVGIKEYEDGKKDILKKIDDLEKEKNIIDSNLTTKEEQLFQQAKERYTEGGKWLDSKKHNGKIITQAEETYKANLDRERAKSKKLKEDKDILIKKLKDDLKDLEATFDSVVWAWNLATNRSSKPSGRLKLGKGHRERIIVMDKLSSGGGFSWIEPFWDDKKPTGSIKNGLYYHSMPQKPDVIIAEWYRADKSKNFVKIDQPVAPGSKVQLHVYTTDLYGQNIQIELKANGKTLKANTYGNTFILYGNKDSKAKTKDSESKYEVQDSKDFFLTEVEVYDYSDPYSIQPPSGSITGHLIGEFDDFSDGRITKLPNVQKAVLDLYVDPIWSFDIPEPEITIRPTIHFLGKTKQLDAELKVNRHKDPEITIPQYGNTPVFVDKVETDFRAFHHCRYDKITAKLEETEIPIFDKETLNSEKSELVLPIVAGNDQARKEVEIIVEGVETEECSFNETEKDHQDHVINISKIENLLSKDPRKSSEQWRAYDAGDKVILGGEKDKSKKSKITNKLTFKNGISKITGQESFQVLEKYTPVDPILIIDKSLKMKLGYDYTFGNTVTPFEGLCYTFFPHNDAVAMHYPLSINTCAYQKNLDIIVYPDTKWTVQLAFNYKADDFKTIQETYHENWKQEQLSASQEKERLKAKKSKSEENIEKYKNEKKDKKTQGKIDKQEKKVANLSNRIDIETQKERNAKRKAGLPARSGNAAKYINPVKGAVEGILDTELTLMVEFDDGNQALNLTSGFDEITEFLKKIADIKEKIDNIINGKDEQSKESSPSENNKKIAERKKKIKAKADSKKSKWSFEFIPPSIGLSVGWFAERPKDLVDKPIIGTTIEGIIDFNPLFGFEIKYDLFQLLYRTHPAVAAIAFALDVLDTIAGDKFDIDLDLIVTTTASGTLKGTINTAEESSYKERLLKDGETPAEVKFSVDISVVGKIRVKGKPSLLVFSKYTAYANVSASIESGVALKFETKMDDKSLFVEPTISFEGLILKYTFSTGIAYDEDDDVGGDSDGVHFNEDGDIVVLDSFSWDISSFKIPIIQF